MTDIQKAIHEETLEVAGQYQGLEGKLLVCLQKVDEKKVYRALGYHSLFDYAVKALKLSEAVAYNFITVARKAKELPQIKEEITKGNLSISTARKIVPVVAKENVSNWIEKAKTLTKVQLEREVAKVLPQVLTPERAKYVAEKRIALTLGVSEEVYEKIKRVKDLVSQKTCKAANLEETLSEVLDLYLERHDPLQKALRAQDKAQRVRELDSKPVPGQVLAVSDDKSQEKFQDKTEIDKTVRPKLPAAVKHAVILRDQSQCSFQLGSGSRCEQKRWLHMHHVTHRSQGGVDSPENITLLCASHHRLVHEQHESA